MRSALAGTASSVVTVKTAAAVPMNVIERMVHLLGVSVPTMRDHMRFLKRLDHLILKWGTFLSSCRNTEELPPRLLALIKNLDEEPERPEGAPKSNA
jgi:hypothetical protein